MSSIPRELTPYLEMGATLFPLPAEQKAPVGIIGNWQTDASSDPNQVERWAAANPSCNWGLVAAMSGLIIVDIDVKSVTPDDAWQAWCDLCKQWESPTLAPSVATPSGGWHIYTRVPATVDAATLRQRTLVASIIDVRTNGYVLIPPSKINGKPYLAYS